MSREEQLKRIIRDMLRPLKDIPLDIIIEAITEGQCTIWPYDGHCKDELQRIARLALGEINRQGILSRRPNEVGNYCEPHVRKAIELAGGSADTPQASNGRRKSTGYPDLEAEIGGKPFYLEVKTYNANNQDTTQRAFYLSPSKDFKITKDAYHLIFAFCMEVMERQGQQMLFRAISCTVIDAHDLPCDVKYEFNSDNRRMYGSDERIVMKIVADEASGHD